MSNNVLISAFAPFKTLSVAVPSETQVGDICLYIHDRYPDFPISLADSLVLSTHLGRVLPPRTLISELAESPNELVTLRLAPRLLGGKGGFGSQLRAAGGRMSSQKTSNNDSCRDLSGRRLSTIKEAKKLADYIEAEPERLAAKAETERAKLEALERKLGIVPSSSSKKASGEAEPDVLAGKKHRFDDTEYLEKSNELKEGVKNAVAAALLKKRKKAKLAHPTGSEDSKNETTTTGEIGKEVKEKDAVKATLITAQPLALDAVGA